MQYRGSTHAVTLLFGFEPQTVQNLEESRRVVCHDTPQTHSNRRRADWTLTSLADALEAKGFMTRATAKIPARPLSPTSLHKMLVRPYYVGIVAYNGVYHQGSHPALIDMDTWLRVQDVLKAHNFAGEKDRKHPHYLKGSIWCGHCGSRMVYSRNTGRHGDTYEYFFCMGKKNKTHRCPRPYVKLPAIEQGVIDFYGSLQLTPERADQIRTVVRVELTGNRDEAVRDMAAARKRREKADHERQKLLEAHYAGAIPLDMMKSEMDRLTREVNQAETTEAAAKLSLTDLDQQLGRALDIATHCARLYEVAKAPTRRMMNQGFFRRLYVAQDGSIEDAELNEPFVQLLARDGVAVIEGRKARARWVLGEEVTPRPERTVTDITRMAGTARGTGATGLAAAEQGVDGTADESASDLATAESSRRCTPGAVLLRFVGQNKPRLERTFGRGSNESLLAEDRGFELACTCLHGGSLRCKKLLLACYASGYIRVCRHLDTPRCNSGIA